MVSCTSDVYLDLKADVLARCACNGPPLADWAAHLLRASWRMLSADGRRRDERASERLQDDDQTITWIPCSKRMIASGGPGVAGRAATAYLKEEQAIMTIVLIYMLGFLVVVAIMLILMSMAIRNMSNSDR
jgi:hypothetical protein